MQSSAAGDGRTFNEEEETRIHSIEGIHGLQIQVTDPWKTIVRFPAQIAKVWLIQNVDHCLGHCNCSIGPDVSDGVQSRVDKR